MPLITAKQFEKRHGSPPENTIRFLVRNCDKNGLRPAIQWKGRVILIDEDAFFKWFFSQCEEHHPRLSALIESKRAEYERRTQAPQPAPKQVSMFRAPSVPRNEPGQWKSSPVDLPPDTAILVQIASLMRERARRIGETYEKYPEVRGVGAAIKEDLLIVANAISAGQLWRI